MESRGEERWSIDLAGISSWARFFQDHKFQKANPEKLLKLTFGDILEVCRLKNMFLYWILQILHFIFILFSFHTPPNYRQRNETILDQKNIQKNVQRKSVL